MRNCIRSHFAITSFNCRGSFSFISFSFSAVDKIVKYWVVLSINLDSWRHRYCISSIWITFNDKRLIETISLSFSLSITPLGGYSLQTQTQHTQTRSVSLFLTHEHTTHTFSHSHTCTRTTHQSHFGLLSVITHMNTRFNTHIYIACT